MTTPIVYDFNALGPRKDDPEPETGDRRILGLFREWLGCAQEEERFPTDTPDDDPAWNALCDRQWDTTQAILDTPSDSMAGFAIKFLIYVYSGWDHEEDERLIRDVARLAPDLARVLFRDARRQ